MLYTENQKPTYEAQATLWLEVPERAGQGLGLHARPADRYESDLFAVLAVGSGTSAGNLPAGRARGRRLRPILGRGTPVGAGRS